jgi:hypothetical protein
MNYIEIEKEQQINLVAKKGATPTQAIHTAIEFCKEHKISQCDLEYFGFTFGIEPDSDINQLVSEYSYWRSLQTER